MHDVRAALAQTLERLTEGQDGYLRSAVTGLALMRHEGSGSLVYDIYTPVLCVVLHGAKQVALCDVVYAVHAGEGLLVSVEVPVVARVDSSESDPYIAMAVDLDLALVDRLSHELSDGEIEGEDRSLTILPCVDERMLSCLFRILALTERPHEQAILMPGLLWEFHYLLLIGPLGATLRRMARPDSHHRRIGTAISLLRKHFAEPLPIDALARSAGMSGSTFHHHFKVVTGCSPRQFQKQLRLLEARRLMQMEGASARSAAFAVGYASAQQFTRDHARQYGAPPRRHLHAETEPSSLSVNPAAPPTSLTQPA